MMSGIRSKNTKPELVIRRALHKLGFRFRLHKADLPGKPDIVFPKYNAVIFTHGCFWHKHKCHLFKWPSTRPDFWKKKINGNRKKDRKLLEELFNQNWRVRIIWECALKGKKRLRLEKVTRSTGKWLKSKRKFSEISGEQ